MINYNKTAENVFSIIEENFSGVTINTVEIKKIIEREIRLLDKNGNKDLIFCNQNFNIESDDSLLYIHILDNQHLKVNLKDHLNTIYESVVNDIKGKVPSQSALSEEEIPNVDVFLYVLANNLEEVVVIKEFFKNKNRYSTKRTQYFIFKVKGYSRTNYQNSSSVSSIRIQSRVESVKLNHGNLNGFIFTANLYDLVNLYKNIGDDLFASNLRIGIDDQNRVDESIQFTINNEHKNFWFYNNGITIICKKDSLLLDKPDHLKFDYNKIKDVTVVNGAQTITSSASAFFTNNDLAKSIKDETQVILRVIVLEEKNEKNEKNTKGSHKRSYYNQSTQIAISLNRQKPITDEDIAYAVRFIEVINSYSNEKKKSNFYFNIVRRGEGENINNREYELLTVAKVLKAYLAVEPGQARSLGKNTLLKIKPMNKTTAAQDVNIEELYFASVDIFLKPNLYNCDNRVEAYREVFSHYFKPVNFSVKLIKKLENIDPDKYRSILEKAAELLDLKDANAITDALKMIDYGKYHILTFIVHLRAGKDELLGNNSFELWTTKEEREINDLQLAKMVLHIAHSWRSVHINESIVNNEDIFDSNTFKIKSTLKVKSRSINEVKPVKTITLDKVYQDLLAKNLKI